MDSAQRRLTHLLGLILDDVATDADCAEFAQLDYDHPHLASGLVETVFTHSLLQWQSEDISALIARELTENAGIEHSLTTSTVLASAFRPAAWATAALLLIAALLGVWAQFRQTTASNPVIAELIAQNDVAWDIVSTALTSASHVGPGRLQTETGAFTLQFRSGPRLHVTAPASLRIESPMLVYLDRGQLTARVPKSGRGFAIKTPVARVVDQGTEFGVAARDDGTTDVIVFEGRVDLQEMAGSQLQPRSLIIGEAARIDGLGSIGRIVEVGRDTSGQWWTGGPKTDEPLIASISDNIVTDVSEHFTCYQTTYGGLQDDTLAYADNPHHEWNGLTPRGLPEFLRGADYIKTFNDYRYRQDFELTLMIAKPANLYVFADNRIPPPDWLREKFEDTEVDIGLDEGPWLYQVPKEYRQLDKNTTSIGGGISIDNTFSVWRRRCTEPGPVTLGDAGKWATEGKQGRAMYGIAVTRLDAHE